MKFFLCILLIGLVYADSPDRRGPERHFDFTKCCKVEKSEAVTQFIESMTKLADQCKQELGIFANVFFFQSTIIKTFIDF